MKHTICIWNTAVEAKSIGVSIHVLSADICSKYCFQELYRCSISTHCCTVTPGRIGVDEWDLSHLVSFSRIALRAASRPRSCRTPKISLAAAFGRSSRSKLRKTESGPQSPLLRVLLSNVRPLFCAKLEMASSSLLQLVGLRKLLGGLDATVAPDAVASQTAAA